MPTTVDNLAGVKEFIRFQCITPVSLDINEPQGGLGFLVTNTPSITKARFVLRQTSDDSIFYGPITATPTANGNEQQIRVLVPQPTQDNYDFSEQYYWTIELYAMVNGVEVISSDSAYLGEVCRQPDFIPFSETPLSITTNPSNQTANTGSTNVTFTAAATGGTTPYAWQWYYTPFNNNTDVSSPVSGATNASYTTANNLGNGTYYYFAIVTDDNGDTAKTTQASLVVSTAVNSLQITQQASNQSVNVGANPSFTVVASATSGAITYQWQVSTDGGTTWTNITGATSSTYTLNNAQSNQSGNQYRPVVTGTGTTPSFINGNPATLTVNVVTTYTWSLYANESDPWNGTSQVPDDSTLIATGTINNPGDAITIPANTSNYSFIDNKYLYLELQNAITNRTQYQNGASNGAIPGSVFRPLATDGVSKFHVSADIWGLNVNDPLIFTA